MAPISSLIRYEKSTAEAGNLPHYETSVKASVTAEQIVKIQQPRQFIHNFNPVKVIPIQLSDLRSDKYQFISPLPATLSEEENLYVVTSHDLNLFGHGETEDEAIQDLCGVIVEYYEELEVNKEHLGKVPSRDKHFMDQKIKKCS